MTAHPSLRNLPRFSTACIGREQETASLGALLRQPDVQLVTLSGPGGVGKTRLALHAADGLSEAFRDGVVFIGLASIGEAASVLPAIAQQLGVKESAGKPLSESIQEALGDQQLLLILDNFERVVEAAPLLVELLAAAPSAKALVTSHLPLHVEGEHELVVEPLALPPLSPLPELAQLWRYPAIALFVSCAQIVSPDFELTSANATTIAAICHRLDGLPLALELVAVRLRELPLERLLSQLNSRLAFLTQGRPDLPARQQTLRATLDWSFSLLEPAEQQLFARMGVFAGGASEEAIHVICAGDDPASALSDLLPSLLDKHMIRLEDGPHGRRYRMLDTVREHALEQLAQRGETERIQHQHARYYLGLVEQNEPKIHGPEQSLWLERLELDHPNMMAAMTWALGHRQVEIALDMAGTLWWFWQTYAHYSEGRRLIEAALALSDGLSHPARARALWGAGWLAFVNGHIDDARNRFAKGHALARALGETRTIGLTLHGLGAALQHKGEYAEAEHAFEESLEVFVQIGDTEHVAWTYQHLGALALVRGTYEQATRWLERGLELFRALEHQWAIAEMLVLLGKVQARQGNYAEAQRLYEESLPIYQELKDKGRMARCCLNLGLVVGARDMRERAEAHYKQALALYDQVGYRPGVLVALEYLAASAGSYGEFVRAGRLYGAATGLAQLLKIPPWTEMREGYQITLATIQAQADPVSFAKAWNEGKALSWEQAIQQALE